MEGEVEVVPPGVGLADGAPGGHVGGVALVADAAAVEIGHHGVGEAVHPVLLTAGSGDVHVALLGGGAEIDDGHGGYLLFSPAYAAEAQEVPRKPP